MHFYISGYVLPIYIQHLLPLSINFAISTYSRLSFVYIGLDLAFLNLLSSHSLALSSSYKVVSSFSSNLLMSRHLLTHIREHKRINTPVGNHFNKCGVHLTMEDVKIIARSMKSEYLLLALKALCIQAIKPSINDKDEYKSWKLVKI